MTETIKEKGKTGNKPRRTRESRKDNQPAQKVTRRKPKKNKSM